MQICVACVNHVKVLIHFVARYISEQLVLEILITFRETRAYYDSFDFVDSLERNL